MCDERVLTMLDKRNKGVSAEVHTRYYEQTKLDFDKHNQQYEPISYVQLPHAVHDRYCELLIPLSDTQTSRSWNYWFESNFQ